MKEYEQKICNIIDNLKAEMRYQCDKIQEQAYKQGYATGYDRGNEDGLKDGYEDGQESLVNAYKDGKADIPYTDTEEAENKAYHRGLNEAWELVKRIESTPEDGGLTNEQIVEVFGQYWSSFELYRVFSVGEAMNLMKTYDDKQKQDAEIKVGDEVDHDGLKSVVVRISNDYVYTVTEIGTTPTYHYTDTELVKTGRTFPQIAEVLAELKGEENDEEK